MPLRIVLIIGFLLISGQSMSQIYYFKYGSGVFSTNFQSDRFANQSLYHPFDVSIGGGWDKFQLSVDYSTTFGRESMRFMNPVFIYTTGDKEAKEVISEEYVALGVRSVIGDPYDNLINVTLSANIGGLFSRWTLYGDVNGYEQILSEYNKAWCWRVSGQTAITIGRDNFRIYLGYRHYLDYPRMIEGQRQTKSYSSGGLTFGLIFQSG